MTEALRLGSVCVVGASLAGLRATEALRAAGYDGRLTVIGAEPHLPYDRPPLSKEVLRGDDGASTVLRADDRYAELDLDLRLGTVATGLDLERRSVLIEGDRVPFDGLVIATGAEPRRLPNTPPLEGIHVLRTVDDCLGLRKDLEREPRVVVVGAGFIGSEVASTCRQRGLKVTVVEALPAPLSRALGLQMGSALGSLHGDNGTDLRCGVGVAGLEGTARVERVVLSDGTAVTADVVVIGIGVVPVTAWLEGSGLDLTDGVVCDATCAAGPPGVVAAGDVARWHNPLFDEVMRVEHWDNAAQQGRAAAVNLLAGADHAIPFAPVPYFWSDQYGMKIQFIGRGGSGDDVVVVHGSIRDRAFVALYGRKGILVGALSVNRPRLMVSYRKLIEERASYAETLAAAGA